MRKKTVFLSILGLMSGTGIGAGIGAFISFLIEGSVNPTWTFIFGYMGCIGGTVAGCILGAASNPALQQNGPGSHNSIEAFIPKACTKIKSSI